MKLDETDSKILEILRKDARTAFTEIGKTLGIADSTVHGRIKKMYESGIIRRYTIDVDDEALGKVRCFLLINVNPGFLNSVVKQLVENEKVTEVFEIHGPSDLLVKIVVDSLNEVREQIVRIREIPNITSSESTTILKTWRRD